MFLDAGRDMNIIFARQDRDGITVDDALVDYLTAKITENADRHGQHRPVGWLRTAVSGERQRRNERRRRGCA